MKKVLIFPDYDLTINTLKKAIRTGQPSAVNTVDSLLINKIVPGNLLAEFEGFLAGGDLHTVLETKSPPILINLWDTEPQHAIIERKKVHVLILDKGDKPNEE